MLILFILLSVCFAQPKPTVEFISDAISVDIDGSALPVGYTLRAPRGKPFDASQPTVIYVNGGPMPFAENPRNNTFISKNFPSDIQVIIVDYIGTSRNGKNFPNLTSDKILSRLNATGQAEVIRNVIKKLKLDKYVIWGSSLGVSVSLRAIDAIQKDQTIRSKPIAAVMDSGSGRQVTKGDLEWSSMCNSHDKTPHTKESNCAPASGLLPSTISSYLHHCYKKKLSPERTSMLIGGLVRYGFPDDPKAIEALLGCPPVEQVDYSVWEFSMACGEFDSEASKSTLNYCRDKCGYPVCGKARVDCQKKCTQSLECKDSPIDVKKLKLGNTSILGIQARDDCGSWPATMDYLMSNLDVPASDYVSVPKGGHVSYQSSNPKNDHWKACHANPGPLFSNLFKGQVTKVGNIMRGCYSSDNTDKEGSSAVSQ
jgi:hypothetical protein